MHPFCGSKGLVSIDGDSVSTLPDFSYYSQQIAAAHPTGVSKDSYVPSSSNNRSCPSVDGEWHATASPLPPFPNHQLCSCMESSLECAVNNDVAPEDYSTLFGTVCGYGVCAGITKNASTGEYGAYSVCNAKQQLSFVFNAYFQQQKAKGRAVSACSFGGAAATKTAKKPSSTCASLLQQAGVSGTGKVPASPTGSPEPGAVSSWASDSSGAAASPLPTLVAQLGVYGSAVLVVALGMLIL